MRPRRLQLRETVEKSFHLAPPVHWKTTPTSKISQQEKIEQELFVAPGAKVKFSIKITTYWGRFAIFTDANSSKRNNPAFAMWSSGTKQSL